jgi:hypothetical protein
MRRCYKIDDRIVIRVTNKEKFSQVDVSDNPIIREDALDDSETKSITSEEFDRELAIAMNRINTLTL